MTYHLDTLALHAGQTPDPDARSRAVPLHRTAAYTFRDTQHAADLFSLKDSGYIYTRIGNPTQDVLEKRVAALEHAPAALALSSGTSAIFYSIINLCSAGDEFVAARSLYGGTYTLFNDILPQFNITAVFADPGSPNDIAQAITSKTRAIFIETISNPTLEVADIEDIAAVAHSHGLPLIVDSTFTTPYLLQPTTHGADIVIHSLTKWMGGHGTGIGGAVVDAGRFNWTDPKFTLYNKPEPSYGDIRFAQDLGDLNSLAYILRMRLVPLRNLGACISPDNAWLFLQGLETLHLRMQRHSENALAVATYLQTHSKVAWVRYPGLPDDPAYPTASKYLRRGFGGMVVFGLKGGASAGQHFIEKLQIFSHLANVGDAKSLAIHPASTTHSQLTTEQQERSGISRQLIRLSVGIEHIDDIVADIDRALAA